MELRKIDRTNIWKIVKLSVEKEQEDFVATNTESILEAYADFQAEGRGFESRLPLPFGLYEEGVPVGFVMFGYGTIGDEDEPSVAENNYCLWRFMIDREYQHRGLGKKALAAALDYIRTFPCGSAEYCWLSYEPENKAAKALYNSFGFVENGETDGEEIVAVLKL